MTLIKLLHCPPSFPQTAIIVRDPIWQQSMPPKMKY